MTDEKIRVYVISQDLDLIHRFGASLDKAIDIEVVGQARDLDTAMGDLAEAVPDVILVHERLEDKAAHLRELSLQLPFASVIAVCPDGDLLAAQKALLSGARAFVFEHADDIEIQRVIRDLYQLEAERRARLVTDPKGDAARKGGKVLAFISPKGGTGRSTLAANAAILIHQMTGSRVILIDARRTLGDLDTLLNLAPTATLADLGPDGTDVDAAFFKSVLLKHASGIQVLLAPQHTDQRRSPSPAGFEHILRLAKDLFDYVIVDAGPLSDPYTGVVLQAADRLLIVTTPEMPALQRTALFVEAAQQFGFPLERLILVVNRSTAQGAISDKQIAEKLPLTRMYAIPEDMAMVTYATNQGIPLVLGQPKNPVSLAIRDLVKNVVPQNGITTSASNQPWTRDSHGRNRLFANPLRRLLG
ncbi:MAG: hypothetical protein Kow0047_02240 [Anaerolineae bacterium]